MDSVQSPNRVNRKPSARRRRALSALPPQQTQETHDNALASIRAFLRGRSSYDIFPVSFRTIVLDNKLEVKKALHALLANCELLQAILGLLLTETIDTAVVSAPLWNSETARFAGMFTVQDIIHLIQYYYQNHSNYDTAGQDVEQFRLESLRGNNNSLPSLDSGSHVRQISSVNSAYLPLPSYLFTQ